MNPTKTPSPSLIKGAYADTPPRRAAPAGSRAQTVSATRFDNLMALYEDWQIKNPAFAGHGSLKRFGEAVGISERQVSHLKQRRRDIGSVTARRVEVALRLPVGYMDTRHTPTPATATSAEVVQGVAGEQLTEADARRLFLVAYRLDPELAIATVRRLYDAAVRSVD
jgi:hypothetical protein